MNRRAPARIAAWTCAVCALMTSASAAPGSDALRKVLQTHASDERTEEDIVERLGLLGPAVAEDLLRLYLGDGVLDLLGTGGKLDPTRWWGGDPQNLGRLALKALGTMPAKDVVPLVEKRLAGTEAIEVRMALTRVLGELRSADGLPALLEITHESGAMAVQYRSVRGPMGQALEGIFRDDRAAWNFLSKHLDEMEPFAVELFVEATGRACQPEAVPVLVGLLGNDPELDLVLIDQIAAICERVPWRVMWAPLDDFVLLLDAEDWRIRRRAAVALGRMSHSDAVPALIESLDDENPSVRRSIAWSLERLVGVDVHGGPAAWDEYLEKERRWWTGRGRELRRSLASEDASVVAATARELMTHKMWREQVVEVLCENLRSDRPESLTVLIAALRQMEDSRAVPYLVDLLTSNNEEVVQQAWVTLKALTGIDLPADWSAWDRYATYGEH